MILFYLFFVDVISSVTSINVLTASCSSYREPPVWEDRSILIRSKKLLKKCSFKYSCFCLFKCEVYISVWCVIIIMIKRKLSPQILRAWCDILLLNAILVILSLLFFDLDHCTVKIVWNPWKIGFANFLPPNWFFF